MRGILLTITRTHHCLIAILFVCALGAGVFYMIRANAQCVADDLACQTMP